MRNINPFIWQQQSSKQQSETKQEEEARCHVSSQRETTNSEKMKETNHYTESIDIVSESEAMGKRSTEIQNNDYCSSNKNDGAFVKPSTPRKKVKQTNKQEDPRIEMAFKILQQSTEEDAIMKYVKYLAEKLNQFDPLTKSTLIHKFNDLIYEAEMLMYSDSPVECEIQFTNSSNSRSPSSSSFSQIHQNISSDMEEFVTFPTS